MELENNQYSIQGIQLNDLFKKYDTPLYVYDGNKILGQYQKLSNSLKVKKCSINYACKANSNLSILKLLCTQGAGLDAVSLQEIHTGLHVGFSPDKIVYTPNGVSIQEIEEAIKLGVKINLDNIEMLEYFGHHYPDYAFGIRINPHILAGGNFNISVGHIDSKFGISIHQIPLVERIVKALKMNINGIHMHTGSDILDINVFLIAADILFETAKKFPTIQYVDFGSGFKVKYKPEDIETDIQEFGQMISDKFNTFCQEMNKEYTLMFEPGKYLVSESGYFFVKTNVIKQTTSTVFAGIDSGFNHLIRPMFYNAHHDMFNVNNPGGKPKIYSVVGYICETDTFGWNRVIEELKINDVIGFKNAGAYCFSMSSNYNSRFRPAEVLILDGKEYLIREREDFSDLMKRQIIAF
jgi:diaminopimelate decarboxylase